MADLAQVPQDRLVSVAASARPVSDLAFAIENLARLRQALRNCARSKRWAGLRATGGLALDALPSGPDRAANLPWEDAGAPIWTVTLHAIVELPKRREWQQLRDDVSASRVVERVQVVPFGNEARADKIAAAIRQPFQHYGVSPYALDGENRLFQWPLGWLAEAFNAIYATGGGLRPLIYSRGFKAAPANARSLSPNTEPMPMLIQGWWND